MRHLDSRYTYLNTRLISVFKTLNFQSGKNESKTKNKILRKGLRKLDRKIYKVNNRTKQKLK